MVQAAKAPASSLHSKEATPEPPGSEPEKVKWAAVEEVGSLGWVSMLVSGALVSTVQVKLSGLASGLPALSVALTEKVWGPSLSEL